MATFHVQACCGWGSVTQKEYLAHAWHRQELAVHFLEAQSGFPRLQDTDLRTAGSHVLTKKTKNSTQLSDPICDSYANTLEAIFLRKL